jgi:hypothetical protein
MKPNGIHIAIAAIVIGSAAGCGGSGATPAPGVTPQAQPPQAEVHTQSLDTAQLLEQARHASDSADPYAVDDGALKLTDTSDSSDPLLVNAI